MPGGGSMASGATVTLFLCGDVMTGRGVDQILRSPVDPAIREPVVQSALDYVALAERAGDLVVVSIHWGGNWGYEVSREERAFAHRLIDRGAADLVHGHSSHHPGPVEIRRERAILYRCGDLLNDYEGISGYEGYRPELALLYFATLDAVTGALRALRLAPVRIRRFRLERADGADAEWLAATLDRESRGFGTRIELGPDGRLHVHAAAEACARSTPGGAGAG
jgi:poly-gamma-glutamate synthesis protein (capsule biosynthesis protein)